MELDREYEYDESELDDTLDQSYFSSESDDDDDDETPKFQEASYFRKISDL
jgi:hypothetical protein